jgi:hypothetical protein
LCGRSKSEADSEEGGVIVAPTVFVLGAGASHPYGLPLGRQLYQAVLDQFGTMTALRLAVAAMTGLASNQIDGFINALRYSGLRSVDAFLERRTEFVDVGKVLMAAELLSRENQEALWAADENWMQYLYARMVTARLEEFAQNEVSFITYNYDRTLEHFFLVSLTNTYGAEVNDCADVLRKVAMIHLHGRLGYLHWQSSKDVVPFQTGGPLSLQTLETCRREIRIVHEDIADREEDFKRARELLQKARRIYLMGFGYASQNVERLKLRDLTPEIFEGTAHGFSQREADEISLEFHRKLTLNQYDCLSFLRERVNWR